MTRVAAVDIGTNSTRLLVAEVEADSVQELDRRLEITRLGEGVDERRILLPQAVARVRNVLAEYRRAAKAADAARTLAFATSAVRDAENGEAFLGEVEWSYGFQTRLLSGHDEALLTFRGVSSGREVAPGTLVIDVGGGSTELILGGPEGVTFHTSLDLGCVRLTERFRTDFDAAAAHVRNVFAPIELQTNSGIGVAGTITTLATLDLGLNEEDPEVVHGHLLSRETVAGWTERLEQMTIDEIRTLRGMHPDRAPVIAAGAVVVREALAHFELEQLEVSEHDIMHGAVLAAAELPEEAEPGAPPSAHTCC
ncbi:MAG TPA: Ppx/GppA phosphatase family protein [Gaiellaceae bacterium]|nr:Ppx/GppA phosphatase family protein [Gaiellaceae bacterium]